MSTVKDITILALTKMHGGVCTAGIDAEGRWVRPVRPRTEQRPSREGVSDYSLLPLDFFHGGKSHLVNLGVTRFQFSDAAPHPPHVEDWTIDMSHKPEHLNKLSETEQAQFLAAHAEDDLAPLCHRHERSLMLVQPDGFSFSFCPNQTGDDVLVRASFDLRDESFADIGCTDLRMRALGRKLLAKTGGGNVSLTDADFRRRGKQTTYLTLGLSRLFQNKHWLILVGVHSLPELAVEIDYNHL
ncbi:MAG: hypothetical protein AB7P14_05935 [Blastocatellales bacterium]